MEKALSNHTTDRSITPSTPPQHILSLSQIVSPVMLKTQDTLDALATALDGLNTLEGFLQREIAALELPDGDNRDAGATAAISTSATNPTPVTETALAKRINRVHRKEYQKLHKTRGHYDKSLVGDWYVIDHNNTVVSCHIDRKVWQGR